MSIINKIRGRVSLFPESKLSWLTELSIMIMMFFVAYLYRGTEPSIYWVLILSGLGWLGYSLTHSRNVWQKTKGVYGRDA